MWSAPTAFIWDDSPTLKHGNPYACFPWFTTSRDKKIVILYNLRRNICQSLRWKNQTILTKIEIYWLIRWITSDYSRPQRWNGSDSVAHDLSLEESHRKREIHQIHFTKEITLQRPCPYVLCEKSRTKSISGGNRPRDRTRRNLLCLLPFPISPLIDQASMGLGCHLERIVDLMADICTMVGIPNTFGDMAMKQMDSLPKGCRRYNVVAEAYYTDRFVKTAERIQRGVGGKYIVKGSNTKIPSKFC